MTGHGGWPMTVFLTPDGVPFYGGTYFPPADRHGMPGFPRVLEAVAEFYRERRGEATRVGQELLERLRQGERVRAGGDLLTPAVLDTAYQGLRSEFDARHGGFGRAPKFPQPMAFDFLLRYWRRRDASDALRMVRETLTRMARGGIYDQLGGGFHRYSVDQVWLVPHFEKMLYDNAQLARLYLQAWQATGDPEYRRVTEETLDYVVREMTHPDGGFYSTQDADSEGEEGKFFVWDRAEIEALLEPETARAALRYWGVADGPNFEGRNILHVPREPAEVAAALGLRPSGWRSSSGSARATLFRHREGRIKPGRDEKVLSGWNGMMLRAFAEAVGRSRTPRLPPGGGAERALPPVRAGRGRPAPADLEGRARQAPRLPGRPRDGRRRAPRAPRGRPLDRSWLDAARRLAGAMVDLFWDPGDRGVLRHRAGPRGARRPAAEPLRLGGAVRLVGGGRRAAAPRGPDRRLGPRAPRGGHDPIGRPAHGTLPLRVRAVPGGAGLPSRIPGRGGPRLAARWSGWRARPRPPPGGGLRPLPPEPGAHRRGGGVRRGPAAPGRQAVRAAGRPPTSARGTRARRPRPSRPTSGGQLDGRGGRPAPAPVR